MQKPFPTSDKRASEPFELIHSDLKSFPIESYRKYKYSIVYYDDYTSQAWTINLRTKDAALAATKQFIAMVETQYQARIVNWKSDAGGEYTSKAFTEMLKDRGIRILQSVPHAHQQNGRAERLIRTLMDKAKSIHLQALSSLRTVHVNIPQDSTPLKPKSHENHKHQYTGTASKSIH